MVGLLVAKQPTTTVVVEQDSTAWWVPFVAALFVALVAALASYYATWRFKRSDVNRENALRAADLIDEAQRTAAGDQKGASATAALLRQALRRASPIDDSNLYDTFIAALDYNFYLQQWQQPPGRCGVLARPSDREYPRGSHCALVRTPALASQ